ncbi:MAG TPA: hypothetical protein VI172_03935 [Candidatus Dormibacteraeota bacterium]
MNREDALAYLKKHGPLPEQPTPDAPRSCAHADFGYPCSCHLTLEQHAVAAELKNYTLYLFGQPFRGRPKVPYYPAPGAPEAVGRPTQEHVAPVASVPEQAPVAATSQAPTSAASRPKRAFDPVYNSAYAKARRRGPEAVAAFKAEWAAKKAAAA